MSALIRYLHNNPHVAAACGVTELAGIPSQPTFSRFGTRLSKQGLRTRVRDVQRALTGRLYQTVPGFGRSVAIDSTTLKAWSNPSKRGTRRGSGAKRQRAHPGLVSDPEAGWSIKGGTNGRKQATFGFKAHIICDAQSELPIAIDASPGNLHDLHKATPLLSQVRHCKFPNPKYVLADAAYSSRALRHTIASQYSAYAVIDPNPRHRAAMRRMERREDWAELYKRRTSVERLNGRLKGFYRLDSIRVRGLDKVMLHVLFSAIALLARAVAFPDAIRRCVRKAVQVTNNSGDAELDRNMRS